MDEPTYRFGSVRYTLAEIKAIAYRHGQDGIKYYPPSIWGSDKEFPPLSGGALDKAYAEAYEQGKRNGYQY